MTVTEEIQKVKDAVNYYMEGAIKRDYEFLMKGWHPKCQMFGLDTEKQLKVYEQSFWKENFAKSIDNSEYKRTSKILDFDIHGTAASAKVKTVVESSKGTTIFIDYLSLLRIDGKWWIVNKIFDTKFTPKE